MSSLSMMNDPQSPASNGKPILTLSLPRSAHGHEPSSSLSSNTKSPSSARGSTGNLLAFNASDPFQAQANLSSLLSTSARASVPQQILSSRASARSVSLSSSQPLPLSPAAVNANPSSMQHNHVSVPPSITIRANTSRPVKHSAPPTTSKFSRYNPLSSVPVPAGGRMSASVVGEDGDDGSSLATLTRAQQLWPKVESSSRGGRQHTMRSRSLHHSSSSPSPSPSMAWEEKVRDLPPPAMRATHELMLEHARRRPPKAAFISGTNTSTSSSSSVPSMTGVARSRSVSDTDWIPYAVAKLKETFTRPVVKQARESNIAAVLAEVRALQPSVSAATTAPSLRLEKLREKRLTRHDDALSGYHELRQQIDRELEQQVGDHSRVLREQLELSNQRLGQLIKEITDQRLVDMTDSDLQSLRSAISQAFGERESSISRLHEELQEVENRRSSLVTAELERVIQQLTDIAHQQPDDIQRLFHDEVRAINVHIIRNRSAYEDLCGRLRVTEIKCYEEIVKQFDERRTAWRTLRHNRVLENFKSAMGAPAFMDPPQRRRLFDQLMATQQAFQQRVMKHVASLLTLCPPNIDPSHVDQLTHELQSMYALNDQQCDQYLLALAADESELHRAATAVFDEFKKELLSIEAFPKEQIEQQIATECEPLVTTRHTSSLDLLDRVQKAVVREDASFTLKIESLSSFYKLAANLWVTQMDKIKKCILDSTQRIAARHDKYQDDKAANEATLNSLIQQLAQEPNREELKARLDQVAALVGPQGVMEETHRQANTDSVALVLAAPRELKALSDSNVDAVAEFFGLRSFAQDARMKEAEAEAKRRAEEEAKEKALKEEEEKKKNKKSAQSSSSSSSSSTGDKPRTPNLDSVGGGPPPGSSSGLSSKKSPRQLKPKELAALAEKHAAEERARKEAEDKRPRVTIPTAGGDITFYLITDVAPFAQSLLDDSHPAIVAARPPPEKPKVEEAPPPPPPPVVEEPKPTGRRAKKAAGTPAKAQDKTSSPKTDKKEKDNKDKDKDGKEQASPATDAPRPGTTASQTGGSKETKEASTTPATSTTAATTTPAAPKKADKSSGAPISKRKKLEELKKKQEEEERLAAEAKIAAEIKAKADAEKAQREANPEDSQGRPCVHRLVFDIDMLQQLLPSVRANFIGAVANLGHSEGERALGVCNQRQVALAKQLDLALRHHRPRYARIESDVYEPRLRQISSNIDRLVRHERGVTQLVGRGTHAFDTRLAGVEAEIDSFKRMVMDYQVQMSSATSLIVLNNINTKVKASWITLKENIVRAQQELMKLLNDSENHSHEAHRQFVESCQPITIANQPSSTSSPDGAVGGVTQSRNGIRQSVLPSAPLVSIPSLSGVYHVREIESVSTQLHGVHTEQSKQFEARHAQLAALQHSFEQLGKLEEFDRSYHGIVEELSVTQGLGHKNGAPKRKLTARLRQEFSVNDEAALAIDNVLDEIQNICSRPLPAPSPNAIPFNNTNGAVPQPVVTVTFTSSPPSPSPLPPNPSTVPSTPSSPPNPPLAASSSSSSSSTSSPLTSGGPPPPSVPVPVCPPDEIGTISLRLLTLVDSLRRQLWSRCRYLDCARPGLPTIDMKDVLLYPVDPAMLPPEEPKEEPKRGAKRAAKKAATSLTTNTGGSPGTPTPGNGTSSSLSSSSSSSSSTSTTPGASTSSAVKKKKSKNEEDEKPQEPVVPRFLDVIGAADKTCREETMILLKSYDEANPDRRKPKETLTTTEGKLEEAKNEAKEKKASPRGKVAAATAAAKKDVTDSKAKKDETGNSKQQSPRVPAKQAPSTRPSKREKKEKEEAAAAVAVTLPPAIEQHCVNEVNRAKAKLEQYIVQFRKQTDRASSLLPQIPRVVFGDVHQRTLSHVLGLTAREDTAFHQRYSELTKLMEFHEATLKPGLSHHEDRVLEQLCAKEEKRYNDTLQLAAAYRDRLLSVESGDAELFLRRLQHGCSSLITLFDSVLAPPDLPPIVVPPPPTSSQGEPDKPKEGDAQPQALPPPPPPVVEEPKQTTIRRAKKAGGTPAKSAPATTTAPESSTPSPSSVASTAAPTPPTPSSTTATSTPPVTAKEPPKQEAGAPSKTAKSSSAVDKSPSSTSKSKVSSREAKAAAAAREAALEEAKALRFPMESWPGIRIDEFTINRDAPVVKEEVAVPRGGRRRGSIAQGGGDNKTPRRSSITAPTSTTASSSTSSRGSSPRRGQTPSASPRINSTTLSTQPTTGGGSRLRASSSHGQRAPGSEDKDSKGKEANNTTGDGGDAPQPKLGPGLTGYQTEANRAVIAARDAAYRDYLDAFRGHTSSIVSRVAAIEREQQLRRQRWTRLVQQLREQ